MNRLILSALVLILGCPALWGQGSPRNSSASRSGAEVATTPITIGKAITFRSKILSDIVSMNLYVPDSFDISSADHTYPVIFVSGEHGRQFFAVMAGIAKHLGDRERIPEALVVSLNDMGDTPDVYTHGMWGRDLLPGAEDPDRSLRHIEEEVIPFLEENYRANDYRMIVGVSGSSLFPIYSFTRAPGLFRSHILIAAADMIGMGYEPDKTFLDAFEKSLIESPSRRAKLYVGAAEDDVVKRDDYRANLDQVAKRLKRFDGMDVRVEVVAKSDHYGVFIKSMLSALDQNFPKERWSSRYRDIVSQPGDALANIDRFYEDFSKEVGFRVLPRADRWNNVNSLRFMTRHLIELERTSEAVAVARRRIEYRPHSSASFAGLADALEANGQLADAIKAQEEALTLAKKNEQTEIFYLAERLAELKKALAPEVSATSPLTLGASAGSP